MGRQKGSLTSEQKARMQAGRRAAKLKAQEGIIGEVKIKKIEKPLTSVFGWAIEGTMIVPIFNSESKNYSGKIYTDPSKAKEAMK
jgi:hypothetical protein